MQQASINDPAALPTVIKSGTPFDWFLQRLVFPNPPPAFAPIQPHGLTRLAIQDRVLGIILLVTALAGEHQE